MSDQLANRIGTILRGISAGLMPMAIFTPVYAVWPIFAWSWAGTVFFALAFAWSAYLAKAGRRLLAIARNLPRQANVYDARVARGMTIVGSVQGGLIVGSALVLIITDQWRWILPAIVLVVALHFFPMPAIFGRTIDYYLGTVMLAVAVVGLYMSAQPDVAWQTAWGVTGLGAGLVTSSYGLWMVLTAKRVLSEYRALDSLV